MDKIVILLLVTVILLIASVVIFVGSFLVSHFLFSSSPESLLVQNRESMKEFREKHPSYFESPCNTTDGENLLLP